MGTTKNSPGGCTGPGCCGGLPPTCPFCSNICGMVVTLPWCVIDLDWDFSSLVWNLNCDTAAGYTVCGANLPITYMEGGVGNINQSHCCDITDVIYDIFYSATCSHTSPNNWTADATLEGDLIFSRGEVSRINAATICLRRNNTTGEYSYKVTLQVYKLIVLEKNFVGTETVTRTTPSPNCTFSRYWDGAFPGPGGVPSGGSPYSNCYDPYTKSGAYPQCNVPEGYFQEQTYLFDSGWIGFSACDDLLNTLSITSSNTGIWDTVAGSGNLPSGTCHFPNVPLTDVTPARKTPYVDTGSVCWSGGNLIPVGLSSMVTECNIEWGWATASSVTTQFRFKGCE